MNNKVFKCLSHREFRFVQLMMVIAIGLAVIAASGCASKTTEGRMLITETEGSGFQPGWVSGDCVSFWGDERKDRICGVGTYSGSGDIANLRSRAIEDARKTVAGELEARVQAVVEHYGKSHHGHDDFGNPPNLKLMKKTSEQITNDAMQLSEINDFWITPKGDVHALVSITAGGFEEALGRMGHLSEHLRKEMHKRVEKTIAQAEEHLRKELEEEAKKLLEREVN